MPIKAELPPSLVMAQATLAGAPPGALRNPVDSARETPALSGTKSISISPKATTKGLFDVIVIFSKVNYSPFSFSTIVFEFFFLEFVRLSLYRELEAELPSYPQKWRGGPQWGKQ